MAEDAARGRQYAYQNNSSLVLESDTRRRHKDEPTGEVESLRGRINYPMGSRAQRAEAPKMKGPKKRKQETSDSGVSVKKLFVGGHKDILKRTEESFSYQPTNDVSRAAYEELLQIMTQYIGDQPAEIMADAAEEVLQIVKNDNLRDDEKHRDTADLLKGLPAHEFNLIVGMAKRMTDFRVHTAEATADDTQGDENDDMDKDMGVAVVFDDEEEEASDIDEIQEVEDDDDDEDMEREGMRVNQTMDDDEDRDDGLNVHDIDAYWLQRQLGQWYKDAEMSDRLAEEVLLVLREADLGACENKLVLLLDYDKFDFIKLLLTNRAKVLFCTRLKQAQSDAERAAIEAEMHADPSGLAILHALAATASAEGWTQARIGALETEARAEAKNLKKLAADGGEAGADTAEATARPLHTIDVEALVFAEGSHFMSNKSYELPEGTWRAQKKGYEEYHVPAVKAKVAAAEEKARKKISSLPAWTHGAFPKMESLNRVQSKMYHAAFETGENLLLCAPTGAGKTNVAMLTILHEVAKARDATTGAIDLNAFKIVYVAPMKALVQEVVDNLTQRLTAAYGIEVRELSGDQNLSREQLFRTQIIVTTPEKWDIITRKSGDDRTYTQLVRLVIIDEIHLLHDTRGPVLEALVARTIRTVESTQQMVRLVGLSATLPNYEDVATFLRVKPDKGVFYFDASYRPVPLQQQYIGIMEKKAMKRHKMMNEICYEKVMEQMKHDNQVLIFCHSRKETVATAKALRDLCLEHDTLSDLLQPQSASSEILQTEAEKNVHSDALKEILPFGFGVHHAGLKREDRSLVEALFGDGHVRVLCCTSTLAWGVNLPAHTVIIKGTQMYSAEKSEWVELSALDILQMLGRAGRIQYDTQGEGIILTQHSQLNYYLSLMNQQLPVESQMLSRLADQLNAEIVLGTVQNLAQAATWLGYSYLYVRMLRAPALYGVPAEEAAADPALLQRRIDLCHAAATVLAKHNLIKYERRTGHFQVTALGKVASHYYVAHDSISTYNEYLKPTMSDIELFRLFSLSHEFKYVMVRSEERLELEKLLERVPIPVKEALNVNVRSANSGSAKVNVLLQAYISRLSLNGFALLADMVHIRQSAARIWRALFEICLHRGWAAMAEKVLTICKMVDHRMWLSHTPLRQFPSLSDTICRKLEKKDIPWDRYFDLSPADIGQLVNMPKLGKELYSLVHKFPKLELSAAVQPITRSLLKVELSVTPDFEMEANNEGFWVLVTDVDGEAIIHHEWLLLQRRFVAANEESYLSFTVPLFEPLAPLYYLRVLSDKWLHCEHTLPISFQDLILPAKNAPATELLDLQPLAVAAVLAKAAVGCGLKDASLVGKVKASLEAGPDGWHFAKLNPIQTQVLPKVLETDANTLLCAPPGSGKGVVADAALLRLCLQNVDDLDSVFCVFLTPKAARARQQLADWTHKFGPDSVWRLSVAALTGDATADLQRLQANVVIATPEQWDVLSRRWRKRPRIQQVALFVAEELQFLGGGEFGPTMEIVLSRMRFIASQVEDHAIRIVGLGNPMANAKDVGDWLGAPADACFSFHPNNRPLPLEVRVQGFEINHFASRMLAMAKPVFNAISHQAGTKPAIVFCPSSKQAQLSAIDLMTFAIAENDPRRFLRRPDVALALPHTDDALLETLKAGVGYVGEAMRPALREYVLQLFREGVLQVLLVPHTLVWELAHVHAFLVVVMGTQAYDGKEHRYVDYPLADVQRMTWFANRPLEDHTAQCTVLCHAAKKRFYAKTLYEPLPVESQLEYFLSDHVNAEVVTKTIESKQDAVDYLTWTLLYRRLLKNPNYYQMHGSTNAHLSDHLSDMVERTVAGLAESRCLAVANELDLSPLNLGMVAAFYYVRHTTIELFACSVTATSKLKALLDVLASAAEFESIAVRFGEDRVLEKLAKHLLWPVAPPYTAAHVKVHILLQMHLSRQHHRLSPYLLEDLRTVLAASVRLLHALVDVISSNGWLKPALATMDLCQMLVQGLQHQASPLLQIPHVTDEVVAAIHAHNEAADEDDAVETPLDILSVDDAVRAKLLPFSPAKMAQVAAFCNAYPDVALETALESPDDIATGDVVSVNVALVREGADDEEEDDDKSVGQVQAQHFPGQKVENWWVVVGDPATNALLSIKRIPLAHKAQLRVDFAAPTTPGEYKYTVYVICDSYLGCDLENELAFSVAQGRDTSGEDDDDESAEE
ncbi:pre-mRNA-splicing helicase BRR2 [Achlya hypogyna]|uniref:Pre-mRNA-splicing helicase BRR2 n=1 Tax=Achlya hypogyna TaxID=1202772 RepID=A0A1V9YMY7_ACHHY|nr:pre-mRNA-splicing helicase BRR2 [Achlya hypogyna]